MDNGTGDATAGRWVARLERSDPGLRSVRVDGRLDQGPALALGRLIDDQVLAEPSVFVLNLSGVSALDQTTASALVAAANRATGLNVKVCVVASNGVAGALRAAAPPRLFGLHGTVAEALAADQGQPDNHPGDTDQPAR